MTLQQKSSHQFLMNDEEEKMLVAKIIGDCSKKTRWSYQKSLIIVAKIIDDCSKKDLTNNEEKEGGSK